MVGKDGSFDTAVVHSHMEMASLLVSRSINLDHS